MLSPENPPKVQTLEITSVQPVTPDLEAALAVAIERVDQGTEFSLILLPILRASWIACDGARTGMVLLEGARANVHVSINLDAGENVATFLPDQRKLSS